MVELLDINGKEEFEKAIQSNLINIILFHISDNEISKTLIDKIQEELIPNLGNIDVVSLLSIDINENPFLRNYFNITTIPTTIIYHKGQRVYFNEQDDDCNVYETDRFVGYQPEIPGYLFRIIEHLIKV